MSRKKRRRTGGGTIGVVVIVLAFFIVMTVQIWMLRQKDSAYAEKEQELLQEYEEETQRTTELDELEDYMNSSEYIEDMAKSKLGLTYDNEIIFKEEK